MQGYLKEGIQTPMAQGRSTEITSMMKWIRASRLSIKNSLSAFSPFRDCRVRPRRPRLPNLRGRGEGLSSREFLYSRAILREDELLDRQSSSSTSWKPLESSREGSRLPQGSGLCTTALHSVYQALCDDGEGAP